MSNPFIPFDPPGDTTGRTAKMLTQRTKPVVNGQPVPPGGAGKLIIPPEDLTFGAQSFLMRLDEQPSGVVEYFPYQRRKYNAKAYNRIRIGTDVHTIGASTSKYVVQWTLTPGSPGSWANAGRFGTEVSVSLAALGPVVSQSFLNHESARQDVWWRVVGVGGDGALSPVTGIVYVQFDVGEEILMERLYWRIGAASIVPTIGAMVEDSATLTPIPPGAPNAECPCPPFAVPFLTIGNPIDEPQRLLHTKGGANTRLQGTTNSLHNDWAGFVGRFVGPPLAAQRYPGSAVIRMACAGQVASALPNGGGVGMAFGIYRPSTEELIATTGPYRSPRPGFRFVPRARIGAGGMGPDDGFDILDDDRPVLDVALTIELGCGCGPFDNAQSLPVWAYYEGLDDGFVNDQTMDFGNVASYVELPKLRYLSEVA